MKRPPNFHQNPQFSYEKTPTPTKTPNFHMKNPPKPQKNALSSVIISNARPFSAQSAVSRSARMAESPHAETRLFWGLNMDFWGFLGVFEVFSSIFEVI
jgi:hypothetical protein